MTVDRRAVAELAPLPARDIWVAEERAIHALIQAELALGDELAGAVPETVDEL